MKLIIHGCSGRMGRALVRRASRDDCVLVGGLESADNHHQGQNLGAVAGLATDVVDVSITCDLALIRQADVVIDFSSVAASLSLIDHAAEAGVALVIGTTGFAHADEARIARAAQHCPIVKSGNMSLGIAVLAELVARAAAALDTTWDIEIFEMHHHAKTDAPSGTALLLGQAAAQGRKQDLHAPTLERTGRRTSGDIGFSVARGGNVIGEHDVMFAGTDERITLSHHAASRDIFAYGALRAAHWLIDKPAGLYTMRDVLDLGNL